MGVVRIIDSTYDGKKWVHLVPEAAQDIDVNGEMHRLTYMVKKDALGDVDLPDGNKLDVNFDLFEYAWGPEGLDYRMVPKRGGKKGDYARFVEGSSLRAALLEDSPYNEWVFEIEVLTAQKSGQYMGQDTAQPGGAESSAHEYQVPSQYYGRYHFSTDGMFHLYQVGSDLVYVPVDAASAGSPSAYVIALDKLSEVEGLDIADDKKEDKKKYYFDEVEANLVLVNEGYPEYFEVGGGNYVTYRIENAPTLETLS